MFVGHITHSNYHWLYLQVARLVLSPLDLVLLGGALHQGVLLAQRHLEQGTTGQVDGLSGAALLSCSLHLSLPGNRQEHLQCHHAQPWL